jgi:cytochrome P450
VARYDDVLTGLKHPGLSSDLTKRGGRTGRRPSRWVPRMLQTLQNSMVTTDDPDHRRLRDLVHVVFTPRMIEQMTQRVDDTARRLLDRAAARGRVDLIADFALPLPLAVISEMLGVPQDQRLKFHRWSAGFLEIGSGVNVLAMLTQVPNGLRLMRFFDGLIEQRRKSPQDDLISGLVTATTGEERLTKEETLSMIFLLLLAGHETTVNLIANGVVTRPA